VSVEEVRLSVRIPPVYSGLDHRDVEWMPMRKALSGSCASNVVGG
jgi:hypothetical protein